MQSCHVHTKGGTGVMRSDYRNYVFDLYGTLVDIRTDEEQSRLWTSFAWYMGLLGMPVEKDALREDFLRLCEASERRRAETLSVQGVEGPYEADVLDVWQTLGAERGVTFTRQQAEEISRVFRALSIKRLRLYPDAAATLRALRSRGKRVMLLSNAQASFTRPELRLLGLEDAFDAVLLSSDAGVRKPSPAFYGRLLNLGLRPEESVMVGNDDLCDCHGAEAVGMDSRYIHTRQSPKRTQPLPAHCRQIASLAALVDGTDRAEG